MVLNHKGVDIHYEDHGNGEVIILLHGFLEDQSMWNDIVPHLSVSNRIITLDLLGHGKTGCLGYIHTMEDMADSVLAVLKHLKIDSTIIIGHSMGGYAALAIAEQHPELIKGLCLMNSTFEADTQERKDIRTRAIAMAKHSFENLIRMSFANLFAPESRKKFKSEYESALAVALQTSVQGYIAAQEGMKIRTNRFEVLKSLKAKKIIILGKKDSIIDGKHLLKKIENTDIFYEEFSEGHMSHIENNKNLLSFLKHFIENL
ncbi:alpha/beta fold hydrolase [Winogradskyella sp. 3972H.M.0a.05]|uniref:alpha/beta fold hydrolase n=1 Tax=Winogradskyella sp. 3972H.M.0a.05 TaxID=2950277 RepID=UPI0033921827